MPTRSSCSGGSTLLLVSLGFDGLIAEKSREKVDSFSRAPFLSLFHWSPPSFPLPKPVGKTWSRLKRTCPFMSSVHFSLDTLDFPITLSLPIGFHSNGMMPCVSYGPHLSLCLTSSQFDMCLILSHSSCATCPAPSSVP